MQRRSFIQSTILATGALVMRTRYAHAIPHRAARQARDVVAMTGTGREVTLTSRTISDLAAKMRGRLLLAGDDGYEQARQIYNPAFDKHPAIIVQVTGVADIRAAVDFARGNGGLLLAVKCGGHSFAGKSTCDRGMMIDLSMFRDVRVDPGTRRARVTGGSLLGAVDHETAPYDLVTPLGNVSDTGVGGLVTGGGFGHVARRFGLSIDNVVSVDIVTADGQLRRASAQENSDLFWGVRGGGGNFGIVTSFELQLHPMARRVIGGAIVFPISKARDALNLYAEYGPRAPDELDLMLELNYPPAGGGEGVAVFSTCYSGRDAAAERALAPIRRLGSALSDEIKSIDYAALQSAWDSKDPQPEYLKSGFVASISPALISAILQSFNGHPQRTTQLLFQPAGGAIARVSPGATAFSQRHAFANMIGSVAWKHGDDSAEHIQWIRQFWSRVEPFTDGFYVNMLDPDRTQAAIKGTYQRNHDRLITLKNKYDPRNLFRLNANVEPTV